MTTGGALDGRVALVTGAARGQGAAEVRALRREGAVVYAGDLDGTAVESSGDGVIPLTLDVRHDDSWLAATERIAADHGRLDVLVNNAGITGRMAPLLELTEDDVRAVLDVNLLGVFLGIKRGAALMTTGASIVNIASVDAVTGMATLGHYSASKFGVRGLTRSAAIELGPRGIRVNAVLPGCIDTPMIDPESLGYDPRPALARRVPLRRVGQAEEIAAMVIFLASNAASFCTGGEYAVDGGWLA